MTILHELTEAEINAVSGGVFNGGGGTQTNSGAFTGNFAGIGGGTNNGTINNGGGAGGTVTIGSTGGNGGAGGTVNGGTNGIG